MHTEHGLKIAGAFFVAVILLTSFGSCDKPRVQHPVLQDTTSAPPDPTGKKYLALGDSYTIGQGVPDADRFPAQTDKQLRLMGINLVQVKYIATTGWTTIGLKNAINTQQPQAQAPYSVVTLLIGVNDQYQIRDTFGYRARFAELLDISVALAGNDRSRVFVLSIPDYSVTPFARGLDTARIREQIDLFNNINRAVTEAANINYTNITPSTREAAIDKSLLASDSLHPSGKEYAKWASILATKMERVLR